MEQEPLLMSDPSSNIHDDLFQEVFRKHGSIMLLINPDTGQVMDANPAAEKFYGYSLSQLKQISASDINVRRSELAEGESSDYFVCQHKLSNGEKRTVEVHSSSIVIGGRTALFAIIHDITGHKQAENEYAHLFKSEQQAHQVTETLRAANLALTRDFNLDTVLGIFLDYLQQLISFDSANVMLLQDDGRLLISAMRGYEKFTDPNQTRAVVFTPHSNPALETVIDKHQSVVIADTRTYPDWERVPGTEHVISWMGVPLIAGGEIIGMYSIDKTRPDFFTEEHQGLAAALAGQASVAIQNARLFTHVQAELIERKNTEKALRESEERYRTLFDRMMDGIYRSTSEGKFVDVNPAMVKMFGYSSREEMLEIDIKKELYFLPEERGSHILDTGREETEVYRMRRKDGTEIWVEDHGNYEHNEQGKVVYHAGMLRDVTERIRAENAWNSQTERLRLMYEASRQLNASFEAQHIYDVTYNSISQLLPCNTFFISSFERHTNMISMICGWHDGAPIDPKKFPSIPLEKEGMGTQSEVIRTGKPLLVPDYQQRLKLAENVYHFDDMGNHVSVIPDHEDIPRSALIVPMIVENQVVGAIQVFSYQLDAYTENDLNLLNAFSSQIAVALINSDLFQRVQRENRDRKRAETSLRSRTRELETLFAISNHISFVQTETEILPQILKELERAIEADTMAVILLEPDEKHLVIANASGDLIPNVGFRFDSTQGISGTILKSRQLYQTNDLSSDPLRIQAISGMDSMGPAIFTPVLSGDHLIGVLLAARGKKKHTNLFTPEVTRMIITASEMLGNAINRVRLHAETMRRLDHLQTLRAMDQVIASSLDLRITLNILLNHTITQLGVDAADVFLLPTFQQTLQYAAGQGFRTRSIENAEIHLHDAFAGRSVMERRIVQVFDPAQISENKPFLRLWMDEGFVNYICVPLIAKGEVKGVLEVYRRSQFVPDAEWLEFLETLAGQAAITIDNAQMFDNLQRVNMELAIAYDATIEGWSRAMDLRDKETEGHTQRVTELTVQLAKAVGIKDKELLHIRRGALLHDIGKMGIPDHILLKQGPLTDEEWIIMRKHPVLAHEMLQPIRYLHQSLDIPISHHEKWDGTGYPRGLAGEQIPLVARIFAIVDVWDAVTSERPYRKAWTKKKALAYIKEQSGKHFDPQVVEMFLNMIK